MPDRQAVEGGAVVGPGGEVVVHEGVEALVVAGFEEVDEFVDEDVFETGGGLFGEFGVEADGAAGGGATAPAGFHMADGDVGDLNAEDGFPFGDEGGQGVFDLVPIPGGEEGLPFGFVGAGADGEVEGGVVQFDGGRGVVLGDGEEVAFAPDVVAFPLQVVPGGFPLLLL